LYFKKNPFNVVPPKEVDFWADRKKPRIEIELLAKTFTKNPSNQIRAIWGPWGNGKSHALGYLKFLFKHHIPKVNFIGGAFPKDATTFAKLYKQQFILNYNFPNFGQTCKKLFKEIEDDDDKLQEVGEDLWDGSYDFTGIVLTTGQIFSDKKNMVEALNDERFRLVRQWFNGEVPKKNLYEIKVDKNPKVDSDFINIMTYLIRLSNSEYGGKRPVVWALDDCHVMRKPNMQPKHIHQIQQGIRTLFDQTATGLLIVISLAASESGKIKDYLISDLKSRLSPGYIKVEQFDAEKLDDAVLFVEELISHPNFKDTKQSKAKYFPFDKESTIKTALERLRDFEDDFTPRTIMKHFANMENRDVKQEGWNEDYINRHFTKLEKEKRDQEKEETEDHD
jgi:hypothetical protein